MWPFRRNAADLDPEQREAVKLLLECAPDLRKAYDLREERRCYGITNISHLFQRIWLDLEGFKLFGI